MMLRCWRIFGYVEPSSVPLFHPVKYPVNSICSSIGSTRPNIPTGSYPCDEVEKEMILR